MDYIIILPNQLFENNNLVDKNTTAYLYEHPVFFTMYKYHKMKLVLHRAYMMYYRDYLIKKYKCKIKYINYNESLSDVCKKKNIEIDMYDPIARNYLKSY